jgi:methionyl-tRNA formyltransferase
MDIVFLGTSGFAVPALDALARRADAGHRVVLVVTRPERPKGRGRAVQPSAVGTRAAELGLEVFSPEKVNAPEAVARLRAASPDLFVVVAYGQILGEAVLAVPRRGAVNVHASLLPKYRGAAPIARAIQRGETETGVSLQFVARELDAGDVIDAATEPIRPDDTAGSLGERLAPLGARVLERNLDALAAGTARRARQDAAQATYAPRLAKEEGRIPWRLPAAAVLNHIRAMTPWPGAFSELEAEGRSIRVVVRAAELAAREVRAAPGTVVGVGPGVDVAAADGIVRITRLLRAGKSEMDAAAFLRGSPLAAGASLS